jgi:hypothetical protein
MRALKRSIRILVIFVLSTLKVTAAQNVEDVDPLGAPQNITLPSDAGSIAAVAFERHFTIRLNERATNTAARFVAVPERKIYWLGYAGSERSNAASSARQFFVLGDKIIAVSTARGDRLEFYISSETLDDDVTRTAQDSFERKLEEFSTKDLDVRRSSFRMEDVLGVFPFGQVSAQGEPAPEITNITVSEANFTLSFRGGKNNDIEATITFGSDFRPVSATVKGKPVFPKAPTPSPTPR